MNKLSLITKQYMVLFSVCLLALQVQAQKLLDNLVSQPTAAYSTRLISSAYTGPAMQIRRCSDDQVVDIYFDARGIVSLNSPVSAEGGGPATSNLLSTWVGDISAYVMIWYDQSGNGNNATQTTLTYQPRIVNTGIVEALPNGTPTLRMLKGATGGNGFNLPFNLLNLNNLNAFVALRQDGNTSIGNHIFGTSGPTGATPGKLQLHYYSTSQLGMQSSVVYGSSKLAVTTGSFINVQFAITPDAVGSGQVSTSSKTGVKVTGLLSTALDNTIPTLFRIGNNTYARNFEGVSPEFIYYDSAISDTDANAILSDQNSSFVQASPRSSSASDLKTNSFTANWSSPLGGTSSSTYTYTIQYSTTADFSSGNILIPNIANTQISRAIIDLSSNTSYWYRVLLTIPGSGGGDSGWSSVQTLRTLAILPISLAGFNVKKVDKGASLNWKTFSEDNNDHFDLQRSSDGENFNFIGQVKGAGNSSTILNYNFIDTAPLTGLNYYRLKQVDVDGNYTLSDLRVLDYKLTTLNPIIYPNPIENILNINLNGLSGSFNIKIVNVSGKVIKQFYFNNQPLDISDLISGTYFIQVINRDNSSHVLTSKFIK